MLKADYKKITLIFKRPGGTSRGVLTTKDSWILSVRDTNNPDIIGTGECSIIYGLSSDPMSTYEAKLNELSHRINEFPEVDLSEYPSIRFGLEIALSDLQSGGKKLLFPSSFTMGKKGIPINGLVWMGEFEFMRQQIIDKLEAGYDCVKLKIGAIDFNKELALLKMIRKDFGKTELELRVDANGAFSADDALEKLKQLSEYHIHSVEQPVRQHQWQEMAELCRLSPIDIALDEELIGLKDNEVTTMLETIKPGYIILKPSLLGGLRRSEFFIEQAEKQGVAWWVTSALESNIGLNAIAQWTATLNNPMPQGLGTGQLYTNNFTSPLYIDKAQLFYHPDTEWMTDIY
ncbi:MAG: o-succinylbenzoate synthase [Bacteroidetes bacterium]|nr:MAG: o-succinylbenzoate synthase [Bacteroidota bacterium]